MIISHTLKIIFVKTKKVGGTSFEIALSKFCGPDCIITPISPDDEKERIRLGYRHAQNFIERDRCGSSDKSHINYKIKGNFSNHDPTQKIFGQVDRDILDRYLKISIYRDPLDFLISQYFFRMQNVIPAYRVPFRKWVVNNYLNIRENYLIAPDKGPFACDRILAYENINEEIRTVSQLPDDFLKVFKSLNAKGNIRDATSRDSLKFFLSNGFSQQEIDNLYIIR